MAGAPTGQVYSTVTRKGQTTIQAEVRERMKIKPGDRIVYEPRENGETVIRAEPGVGVLLGVGSKYARRPATDDFAAEREAAAKGWAKDATGPASAGR